MKEKIRDLIADLNAGIENLNRFNSLFLEFLARPNAPDTIYTMQIAAFLEKYYTFSETLFVRIAAFYGNGLEGERWHRDLLSRMRQRRPGEREAVLREKTWLFLEKLLRFRHFSRHYAEFDYDAEEIELLIAKYKKESGYLREDLENFILFLENLLE